MYINAKIFSVCQGKLIIVKIIIKNINKKPSFDFIKKFLPLIENVGILLINKPLIKIT